MTKDTNNQLIQEARELAAQVLIDRAAQTRQMPPMFRKAHVSTNCISSDDALGDYVGVYRKTRNACYKD